MLASLLAAPTRLLIPALFLAASSLDAQAPPTSDAARAPLAAYQPVALRTVTSTAFDVAVDVPDSLPPQRRARSEWYGRRLAVHRYASYAMVPLFIAQYTLGSRLIGQKEDQFAGRRLDPIDGGLRSSHRAVAAGVATLFVVNTTTGLWNLIEARGDAQGRGHRTAHAITMLAADAGFVYTGVLGSRASDGGLSQARTHRNTALTSFGIATGGAAMMWFRPE
jgi:hypothetical protein